MEWIDIKEELPAKSGKYIVECKTMMGNINRTETLVNVENDKVSFGVTNQTVLKWLKEHPVEEKMYSRGQIVNLLNMAYDVAYENCQYDYSVTATARWVSFDKWIEENL